MSSEIRRSSSVLTASARSTGTKSSASRTTSSAVRFRVGGWRF